MDKSDVMMVLAIVFTAVGFAFGLSLGEKQTKEKYELLTRSKDVLEQEIQLNTRLDQIELDLLTQVTNGDAQPQPQSPLPELSLPLLQEELREFLERRQIRENEISEICFRVTYPEEKDSSGNYVRSVQWRLLSEAGAWETPPSTE